MIKPIFHDPNHNQNGDQKGKWELHWAWAPRKNVFLGTIQSRPFIKYILNKLLAVIESDLFFVLHIFFLAHTKRRYENQREQEGIVSNDCHLEKVGDQNHLLFISNFAALLVPVLFKMVGRKWLTLRN